MRSLILFIVLLAGAVTQAQSYRQLAVESKGQAGATSSGCGWAGPPLASIVRFADVAVEGIVLSTRTYATTGDRDIFTDYEIATKQVIFQRVVQTTAKPGLPPPTIFKTRGGTVVFDGYPFTLNVESAGRRAQLDVGDHLVLFGRYDQADGKWLFGPRDFFQISEATVINWLPTLDELPEGLEPRMPLAAFAQKVRDLSR